MPEEELPELFMCGDPALLAQAGFDLVQLKWLLKLVTLQCSFCGADVCCDSETYKLLTSKPNGRAVCVRCVCRAKGIAITRMPQ